MNLAIISHLNFSMGFAFNFENNFLIIYLIFASCFGIFNFITAHENIYNFPAPKDMKFVPFLYDTKINFAATEHTFINKSGEKPFVF